MPAMAAMSFCLLMFILVFAFSASSTVSLLEEPLTVTCCGMRGCVKELGPREEGCEGGLELEGGGSIMPKRESDLCRN